MSTPTVKPFYETVLLPQEELLEIGKKKRKLQIGVPRETCMQENRIALTPDAVALLVNHGHQVVLETLAGSGSRFTDKDFSEAGAQICYSPKEAFECHIVLKVEPPSIDELDYFKTEQTLISALQIKARDRAYFQKLVEKKITALAFEHLQDDEEMLPIVRCMSEIAGSTSILIAAEYLSNVHEGKGYMMGGITGVPPTEVVIIGAGTVGTYAARTALGLGAVVKVFDQSLTRLKRLQDTLYAPVYTSVLNPQVLAKALSRCDVAIGAIRSNTGRTPCVVTTDMVAHMKPLSVIVDVSIDQGGCFETSELTNHDEPVFKTYDVIHYCVPNIASRVSRTASVAISNICAPLLLALGDEGGVDSILRYKQHIREGIYVYKGVLTNASIGEWFDLPYSDINLLVGKY
ncbi:MAG: alanine dehydrogenase [Schleiferiaceae bacterium]|nr:alanine dehydrogenase [Schleiferiaceae bacterium]